MKKLLALLMVAVLGLPGLAQRPLFVGHRGSSYGVENSVESFTNGAKLGYEYLETDFKVTKDKQLVCTHDDDLSRLGGSSLTIAGSTLAELQAVTLTQTRLGTKYTGRLCSAQEYLDVCKQYGVRPLIELKWATGINSNDCSNIPLLIKLVEDNGFRDKCIIMTSMKPCLEYIRTHYPDIELQFLTGQYWANHFDWCVKWNIDADIQAGYFDKATVQKYHDADLKVNMWTTNNNDGYKQYGNWGCDFITTDNLDPKSLPELDASATDPVNTIDFPNLSAETKGYYKPLPESELAMPADITAMGFRKAVMRDGKWYLLCNGSGVNKMVTVDAKDGVLAEISTEGITGTPADISLSSDNAVVAAVPAEDKVLLYKWDTPASAPAKFAEFAMPEGFSTLGEALGVSGRIANLRIVMAGVRDGKNMLATATVVKGSVSDLNVVEAAILDGADLSKVFIGPSHSSRRNFVIESADKGADLRLFDIEGNAAKLVSNVTPAADGKYMAGLSQLRYANKVYAMLPVVADGKFSAVLSDVTAGFEAPQAVADALPGAEYASFGWTGFSREDGLTMMHLITDKSLVTYVMDKAEEDIVYDVELEFERDWILSNTTGNHPGNIDGQHAQQGTAVKGIFYINNCSEKKLHMFDQTGHIGTVTGGAGWGCTRDDAGNIIIRDDKQTGTSHSFLIYPAGLKPGDNVTPVKLSATVLVAGQTNFIGASGDVLNGNGHIYMYPNGSVNINVIALKNGAITGYTKSDDVKVKGTTAGYIVGVKDNPDHFIYNIRGSGIYEYKSGVNNDVSTSRASTTAPARNSTGGFAYFKLRGNQILAHNSGANYKGGFTVRNLTSDKVIGSIDPIGSNGYVSSGTGVNSNFSTFNWLIPEKVDDSTYKIYQYCPSNGIAVYTLHDKMSGVDNIIADDVESVDENAPVEYYNLQGVRLSEPAPGQLVIRRQGSRATKVIIR